MAICKPLKAEVTSKSISEFDPCHASFRKIQQLPSQIDVMCGGTATGLQTELAGLHFDAERIKTRMLDNLVNSTFLVDYINRKIPYDTPTMTCDNLTDYLISVFALMMNVTKSLDEIEKSSFCSQNTLDVVKGDLKQLSLKTNQVACSMTANGLHLIADVSSLPIGPLSVVSACADPTVNHADVIGMIYNLSALMERTTKQEYEDISSLCNHDNCTDRSLTTTRVHIVDIIG